MERERPSPDGEEDQNDASSETRRRIENLERAVVDLSSVLQRLDDREARVFARVRESRPEVYLAAAETFGSSDKALVWLNRPNVIFEGRSPAEILDDPDGPDRVRTLLGRIAHGLSA